MRPANILRRLAKTWNQGGQCLLRAKGGVAWINQSKYIRSYLVCPALIRILRISQWWSFWATDFGVSPTLSAVFCNKSHPILILYSFHHTSQTLEVQQGPLQHRVINFPDGGTNFSFLSFFLSFPGRAEQRAAGQKRARIRPHYLDNFHLSSRLSRASDSVLPLEQQNMEQLHQLK